MNGSNNKIEKGRVIVFLWPEHSAYNASFPFSRLLEKQEYRVVYAGISGFKDYVLKQGFSYEVIEGMDDFYTERLRSKYPRSATAYITLLKKMEEWLSAAAPRLAFLHPFLFDYSPPFLELKIPIIGLNNECASVYDPLIPPVFSGIVPGSDPSRLSRAGNFLAWSGLYIKHLYRESVKNLSLFNSHGFASRGLRAKTLVKKTGARFRWGEYGYRLQVPEIMLVPREFDFPRVSQWTPRCYAGMGVEAPRNSKPFDWSKIDENKPLVYLALGSHGNIWKYKMRLYRAAVQAVEERSDWQLILQIADQREAAEFKSLPGNVIIEKWVPQMEILSRAFLFITHGGISSVKEAVHNGVPMIVFPCGVDQPGNASRVEFHHLGLKGNIKKINAGTLGILMDRISNDPSFRRSLKKMRKALRKYKDGGETVAFIEHQVEHQVKTAKTVITGGS